MPSVPLLPSPYPILSSNAHHAVLVSLFRYFRARLSLAREPAAVTPVGGETAVSFLLAFCCSGGELPDRSFGVGFFEPPSVCAEEALEMNT